MIRGFKIKKRNGYIVERPIQLVKDLEIRHPVEEVANTNTVDDHVKDGQQRRRNPTRKAKLDANDKIVAVNLNEEEEFFW